MARSLCIVILVAFSIVASSAINCNRTACNPNGRQHTLCLYLDPNPAQACGKVLSVGLTNDEKQQIVDSHNQHRSFVAQGSEQRGKPGPQPPALNMQHMVWDDELAEIAQRWVNQCTLGHDQWRDVDRFYVGQNAAMGSTTGTVHWKPSDMVDMWYNEVKNMDSNQVSRYANADGVRQYTQLVWASSDKLGCGKIAYQPDSTNRENYYVVCNYGPTGNIIGEPIYLIKH